MKLFGGNGMPTGVKFGDLIGTTTSLFIRLDNIFIKCFACYQLTMSHG